ncbi:MAG: hypothetical protein HYY36_04660 [Gammaproteobacteria bacterium]|nr:hypothetical protein [Gammaproteobacteria bacterium]
MRGVTLILVVLGPMLCANTAAEGHGPAFGLATPTLARGQWSSDTVAMQLQTEQGDTWMFREMLGYGITEDLQLSLSFPFARTDRLDDPPRTRVGSMMGAFGDVEGSLLWRFQRTAPAVGVRWESALLAGISAPAEGGRGGVAVGPALHLGAVTGYASRTVYWWLGGGAQLYAEDDGDELGNLYYMSGVFGWRPPLFRRDYPRPDWRLFVEALAEFADRNEIKSRADPDSGGQKILLGPSVLGLYGRWGMEAGVLFPVAEDLNGDQPEEDYRLKLVFTYWF